jgi:hypothetical protein
MMQIIHCTNCNKTGTMSTHLYFNYLVKNCNCCYRIETFHWNYYFCNMQCMFEWLKKYEIEKNGFPCQSCKSTGFDYGFELNGICHVCNGNKVIKEQINWSKECKEKSQLKN